MSEGTENCLIRTTFNLILKAANSKRSGIYSCGTENIQSADVYVEVLSGVQVDGGSIHPWSQSLIFEYATEALELYGVRKVGKVNENCRENRKFRLINEGIIDFFKLLVLGSR